MNLPSRKFMRQLLLFIAAMMLAFGVAIHADSAGEDQTVVETRSASRKSSTFTATSMKLFGSGFRSPLTVDSGQGMP
jgi:hypothetical protein